MKRSLILTGLSLAILAAGAPAVAQDRGGRPRPPTFEELDADGDGVVSLEEFLVRPQERFEAIDTDDDGVLTEEELEAAHPPRPRRSGQSEQ